MLKDRTYFEQVPVKVVLKIARVEPGSKVPINKEKSAGRASGRTTRKNRVSNE
jgi:hypothetical protein